MNRLHVLIRRTRLAARSRRRGAGVLAALLPLCVVPVAAQEKVPPTQVAWTDYLADDVLAVAAINVRKVEPDAVLAQLERLGGAAPSEAADLLKKLVDQTRTAQIERVYVLFRRADLEDGGPCWIATLADGADEQASLATLTAALTEELRGATPDRPPSPPVMRAAAGLLLGAVTEGQLEQLVATKSNGRTLRDAQAAALDDISGADVGIAVWGDADARRVLREMLPPLPAPWSAIDGPLIADRVQAASVVVTLPPRLEAKAVVRTTDAAAAQTLAAAVQVGLAQVRVALASQQPALDRVAAALRGEHSAGQVTITLDGAAAERAVGEMVLPQVVVARQAALSAQRVNQLKQIALAFHMYADQRRALPPAAIADAQGRPLLSWRVALLPYLGAKELYGKFRLDEPWDSPHNRALAVEMPAVFADPDPHERRAMGGEDRTAYLVPTGVRTVFSGVEGRRFEEITDGMSNTVWCVQAASSRAVVWTQPADWEVEFDDPLAGLRQAGREAFAVARCDGSVVRVALDVAPAEFAKSLTPAGGEPLK